MVYGQIGVTPSPCEDCDKLRGIVTMPDGSAKFKGTCYLGGTNSDGTPRAPKSGCVQHRVVEKEKVKILTVANQKLVFTGGIGTPPSTRTPPHSNPQLLFDGGWFKSTGVFLCTNIATHAKLWSH